MRRVCPRQEVQDVKENILIHKVEKLKGRVVPVSIVVHFFLAQKQGAAIEVCFMFAN